MMFQCSHNFDIHPGIYCFILTRLALLFPLLLGLHPFISSLPTDQCQRLQASRMPFISPERRFNPQTSGLLCTWFWFKKWWDGREQVWRERQRQTQSKKQACKAVIIHWKSLANIQYPLQFTLSGDWNWSTVQQRPAVIKSSSSIWRLFKLGLPHVRKIPQWFI